MQTGQHTNHTTEEHLTKHPNNNYKHQKPNPTIRIIPQKLENCKVRPLIKKHGMDLVKSSYRPVSNLSYISKLVEKAMLDQTNNTVMPIISY